ncbi:MAG: TIGR04211 family SH3 domain-containing protein [Halioglobus sp.]|nr:TIGR04211 family SH3 domain-containing protein [Halioglobus sp.]
MRVIAVFCFFLFVACGTALAQEVRYISDKQYVPVRSGAGNQYRIVHRGLPSGTRMTVSRSSADGVWSEITTAGGTSGWVRSQYLTAEPPAQLKLESAEARAEAAEARLTELEATITTLQAERNELQDKLASTNTTLDTVSEELNQLKQISGKSVQLDSENRRLAEVTENLRAEVGTLEAENQRLTDKLRNEGFLNGALAVLLGVIIALVVPRLAPKRRRSSSWA